MNIVCLVRSPRKQSQYMSFKALHRTNLKALHRTILCFDVEIYVVNSSCTLYIFKILFPLVKAYVIQTKTFTIQ